MAEEQLQVFLEKVLQLNAFIALSEARPELRQALRACSSHQEVVSLARAQGYEIGRRWGEPAAGAERKDGLGNLLESPCPPSGEERVDVLLDDSGLRLERIHSCSHSTRAGHWYDQLESEWILLLRGSARLQFEDEEEARDLVAGDSLLIAPRRRHRVVATDPAPGTLWFALFWTPSPSVWKSAPASSPPTGSPP
ncbi:Nif11 domain/cupin domain-containing protein [Synechococcus sp. BSF8S]|uniref:Nif11 domain/cupin domain-containing protein n=1 Tax=Synechococcales TaxID=1890424 RepID=UPI00162A53E0|nr:MULTISPECIES: Nif11 domain/cupin domain-containing protein [unclassified Synechococcus]MBC1260896.1 Nif11 domain/cupin domain-containing protein [Synechococcus sp. BSF8S]MBC1263572.1 Nif11 domain/cupin domain-containing protein [Synechococcus sp. BSA11S]